MNDISVILNGYKRPNYLKEQIKAIQNQTILPKDIFYWQNSIPGIAYEQCNDTISAICNVNLGVWSRFAFALNVKTNWVCIFDDDTIPGCKWFENCLETHKTNPGLLGTIGVLFGCNQYHNVTRIGWDNPNDHVQQVDIVGHSWFFHRDLLSVFWRELPPLQQIMKVGEDIHFSHMIQKYSPNNATWVPPHPINNHDMWGSLKGWVYGDDGLATASTNMNAMDFCLKQAIANGFKLL